LTAAARLLTALRQRGLTLAVAESFTGGRLMDQLTDVPGSSLVFLGGVVAYDDTVKARVLRVPASTITRRGAVSEEVAAKMARGDADLLGADVGLSTTGIAGPSGATATKPVGLSIVAVAGPQVVFMDRKVWKGGRAQVKERAVEQALLLCLRSLGPQPSKRPRVSSRP
jgi:PncC family amidohydrolase